jgi:hypothetical protein
MNRDEIEKLLEDVAQNQPRVCVAWCGKAKDDCACYKSGVAVGALNDAAPDLARTCLDLMARLEDAEARLAAAEAQVGALQSWFRRRYSGGHDEGCAAKTHVNRSCSCGWDTLYAALASAAGGAK